MILDDALDVKSQSDILYRKEVPTMPTMLTLNQAAEATGLTYNCLRRWILSGEFGFYVKAGSRYYVNMERLEEFLDSPASAKK